MTGLANPYGGLMVLSSRSPAILCRRPPKAKGDIVVVKGANPRASNGSVPHENLPLVALVNGGAAVEAELVAGTLRDNRRAVLLGSKTCGESSITSVIP
jgi:carboxyl-terminal processing protease